MKLNFFPFCVVKKCNLRNEYLNKLSDSEILAFIFKELEKEEYKKIQLTETTIELQGDHSELFFSFRPIWVVTQAIDFGTVTISHKKNKRKVVFKYQSTLYHFPGLLFGLIVLLISKSLFYGFLTFLIVFILNWLYLYIIQSATISVCIDKLEYKEHRKDL